MHLTTLPGPAVVLTALITTGLGCSNSVPDEGTSPQVEVDIKAESAHATADAENGPDPTSEPSEPEPSAEASATSAPVASAKPESPPPAGAGKVCQSAADCTADQVCFGPQGCGETWTCGPLRACTRDLVTFCGCDGTEFKGSGSCPSRPYRARGRCP